MEALLDVLAAARSTPCRHLKIRWWFRLDELRKQSRAVELLLNRRRRRRVVAAARRKADHHAAAGAATRHEVGSSSVAAAAHDVSAMAAVAEAAIAEDEAAVPPKVSAPVTLRGSTALDPIVIDDNVDDNEIDWDALAASSSNEEH